MPFSNQSTPSQDFCISFCTPWECAARYTIALLFFWSPCGILSVLQRTIRLCRYHFSYHRHVIVLLLFGAISFWGLSGLLLSYTFLSFFKPVVATVSHWSLNDSKSLQVPRTCAYTTCSYCQIWISCTIPGGSHDPPSCVKSYTIILIIIMHIYQPLRSGRIWHKVNF